jgi:DNA-binding CsgD family transcriptional regulator
LPSREEVGHWVETYLPIRDLENRVTQVAAFVVELTGFKNFEVSLNHIILLHASAGLKTELQFFATSGHFSDGSTGLLPRAIELIDDYIGYARRISGLSHRYISADVPGVQADNDDVYATGVNKADTTIKAGGEQWRRMLSGREHEVFKLLADCKSNKEIASEMNLSVRTAETYRGRVMMKLELPSIDHLVRFAVRNTIIKA